MTSKRHHSLLQHKIEGFFLARGCQCDNVLQSGYSGQFRRYHSLITASDNAALLPGVGGREGRQSHLLSHHPPPTPDMTPLSLAHCQILPGLVCVLPNSISPPSLLESMPRKLCLTLLSLRLKHSIFGTRIMKTIGLFF